MERKFLEELGLDKEAVDKIMAEHGKDVQSEINKFTEKEKELKLISSQLTEANEAIKSYKGMNIDEIKLSANEWEEKSKNLESELSKTRSNATLVRELFGLNVHDLDWLISSLDMDNLKFEDNKVNGLEEQIISLKETKPFLFKETKAEEPKKEERFEMIKPEPSEGGLKEEPKTYEDFLKEVEGK